MDLISRKVAQTRLKEICKKYSIMYDDTNENKYNTCATEFGHAFDDLPSQNQWIPCNERLPEERDVKGALMSEVVMVTVYDIERDKVMGVNCDMTINGEWFGYQNCDGTEVIAWQPLPEPYKAESEE